MKQLRLPPAEAKPVKPPPEKVFAADEEIMSGVPRDVNMGKLDKMLKSGKLSDREAGFYGKME
jgi:hypothetical protein